MESTPRVDRVEGKAELPPLTPYSPEVLGSLPSRTPAAQSTVDIPILEIGTNEINRTRAFNRDSTTARIYDNNRRSIVKINTLDAATAREGLGSTGSGFFVNADGLIATGYHVVRDAVEIRVRLDDGRTYKARVKDISPSKDLAVLEIEKDFPWERFQPVQLEQSSKDVRADSKLLALGNPSNSDRVHVSPLALVSRPRISELQVNGGLLPGEDPERQVIRTAGRVTNGNSGGPVFDAATGRVVGIVNLSNSRDTYINPVEDLHNYLQRLKLSYPSAPARVSDRPSTTAPPTLVRPPIWAYPYPAVGPSIPGYPGPLQPGREGQGLHVAPGGPYTFRLPPVVPFAPLPSDSRGVSPVPESKEPSPPSVPRSSVWPAILPPDRGRQDGAQRQAPSSYSPGSFLDRFKAKLR